MYNNDDENSGYPPKRKKWNGAKTKKEIIPFYKREIIYDDKKLFRYAINKLAKQDWGRVELFKKMKNYQKDESIINTVLDKLETLGYLSDKRRINSVLNAFSQREAVNKTSQRLSQRGFTKDQIKEVVEEREELVFVDSQEELPLNLLERKFKNFIGQEFNSDEKRKLQEKMTRFLAGRGFGYDLIRNAMKEFFLKEAED